MVSEDAVLVLANCVAIIKYEDIQKGAGFRDIGSSSEWQNMTFSEISESISDKNVKEKGN